MKYEKCNSGLLLPTLSESNRMKASKPEFQKKLIGSKSWKSTAEQEQDSATVLSTSSKCMKCKIFQADVWNKIRHKKLHSVAVDSKFFSKSTAHESRSPVSNLKTLSK